MAFHTFTFRVVFLSHPSLGQVSPWCFSTRMTPSGLLIPVSYLQLLSFPLGPCTKSISHLLRCLWHIQTDIFHSVLGKLMNFNSQQHYSFFFFYYRKHSYFFWGQMHPSMLGSVVPMDTDVCLAVAEWVQWDRRHFLVIFIILWTYSRIASLFQYHLK